MEQYELSSALAGSKQFVQHVQRSSGVHLSECYQCGKCSAGCPVAFAMDYTPRQIIRLLQLGLKDEALRSRTIWLCAHCQTCYTRCPREVELPRLMETLQGEARKAGKLPEKNLNLFNELFLKSVEKNGRVHEMGLMILFNLQSGQPLKDAALAPKLFFDGKIHPSPHKIKDGGAVKRIFEKVRAHGGEV
ncbi:heterodisulfide reductase subunit C [Clostridiales bacterium PH28_bin88]|nr:heterodisulfide reductase subunit C [Clostridiales bacterium PH28_bin88]